MSPLHAARLRRKLDLGEGTVDPRAVTRILERNCYLKEFFLELLPREGAVIDAGAQVGCFTVLALELLEPDLLVAFEPDRANFDLLVKNVAAVESSARVETVQTEPWSSADRLPSVTLDHQLDQLGVGNAAVRVLRIRAEGAENEILEGGRECLRRTSGLVGEVQQGVTQIGRFRQLLEGFVVAIGVPTPPAGLRPFWAVREDLIPAKRRRYFLERAEVAGLQESLWQLTEDRLETTQELESKTAMFLGSFDEIERTLRLDRDVIEWQKGSLVRLRRDHDAGLRRSAEVRDADLRRSAEMHAELQRSLGGLDERLADQGRHLEAVEDSVRRAADLARQLAQETNRALRASAAELEERLEVLGRRLNTMQESARLEPDLAQPLLSSKPWRAYLWLGRAKRAVARKLAPLTGRLGSAGAARRQADEDATPSWNRLQRSRRAPRYRALFIDRRLPTPDRDAASLRISNLTAVLQEAHFEVSFLPHDLQAVEPYATDLRGRGVEVLAAPDIDSVTAHLEDKGPEYDLVIISRGPVAANCIREVRACCPGAKVVFDTVDLEYLRESRLAELEDSDTRRAAAAHRRQLELSTARRADLTLVVSEAERELLARDAPELAVHVLSTIHHRHFDSQGFAARRDLLFLADFGQPHNVDAALWLVNEILPAIQAHLPDACLRLVGSEPTAEVRALASDKVVVTGFVPDVEPYLGSSRVFVAPLRYPAGILAETTQAMAMGLPCVTTTIGAEGIGLEHGRDAMIADGTEELADCVARVYGDQELWLRLSQGGMNRVRDAYSFAAARRSVLAMLEAVGHPWALERKFHFAEFGTPD